LCLDKGYDNPTGHAAVEKKNYTSHIRRIGEEKLDKKGRKSRATASSFIRFLRACAPSDSRLV
jgi:hypothetical protein